MLVKNILFELLNSILCSIFKEKISNLLIRLNVEISYVLFKFYRLYIYFLLENNIRTLMTSFMPFNDECMREH